MKMPNLGMEKAQAWNAYREYRALIGQSGDQRDRAVMQGYKELAKGRIVIDLVQVMREAGFYETGMPRLAICRADATTCKCNRRSDGYLSFSSDGIRKDIVFDVGIFPRTLDGQWKFGRAVVPLIPLKFRPAKTVLKNYHLLWEAEWHEVPKDPALLKHLSGNLYSVVAMWDLTPIEQAGLRR